MEKGHLGASQTFLGESAVLELLGKLYEDPGSCRDGRGAVGSIDGGSSTGARPSHVGPEYINKGNARWELAMGQLPVGSRAWT